MGMDCEVNHLIVYDGNEENEENLLFKTCESTSPLPDIRSKTNQLLIKIGSAFLWHDIGFAADVSFTYGEIII